VLLITHDLGVVAGVADQVAVMYAGQIIEQAAQAEFYRAPRHPYSQKLFESLPDIRKRDHRLAVIHGAVPALSQTFRGCRFAARCDFAWQDCRDTPPGWSSVSLSQRARCHLLDSAYVHHRKESTSPQQAQSDGGRPHGGKVSTSGRLLEVEEIKVHFPIQQGLFKRTVGHVYAVDGVTLRVDQGVTVALVGESGCGKTTIGKSILQLIRPTSGQVRFAGEELTRLRGEALRRRRADFQIIFQDPFSSMNPRMMVGEIIQEGMVALGVEKDPKRRQQRVVELLKQVGLPAEAQGRYPHEFSGGQRQRICIARTLAVKPKLIICDEPTSALDISVQAQILNLLKGLQNDLALSYLFITHNLSVVSYLADEVAVMYLGRIVEYGTVEEILQQAHHPYTQALLSAIPVIDPAAQREVIRLEGDLPSPSDPPQGCHFHTRCPKVMPVCRQAYPAATAISTSHRTHCFLYGDAVLEKTAQA